jgi:hypothetical protein
MILRRTSLALAAAALMSAPAWAPAVAAPSGHPHSGSGAEHGKSGADHGKGKGSHGRHLGTSGHPGKSHKCAPHAVGYVASGTLEAQSLTENANGTYSGSLSVDVTRANRHARGDLGKHEYTVEDVRVTFGLKDLDGDAAGIDDIAAGDRARLLGRITTLAKKCPAGEFTPTTSIRHIVFHAPLPSKS